MKYVKIMMLTMCMVFCMTAISFASAFQTTDTKYGTIGSEGIGGSFAENGYNIKIAFVPSGSQMTMYVGKDNDVIYNTKFAYHKYLRIDQVYDNNSGKYAYIIMCSDNMDGDGGFTYLMGYDTQKDTWQLYVNPANYYNPIGDYADTHMYVSDGELILSYYMLSKHPQAQEYHFFWDENSNWFGYKDYGIVQH